MTKAFALLRRDFGAYPHGTRQALLPHFLLLSLIACTAFFFILHFKPELLRMLHFVHGAPQAMAQGYLQLHYTSIIYVLGGAALTLAVNRFYLIYLSAGFLTVAIAQIRGLAARLSTDHSTHSMIEHFEYIYVANVANAGMIIRLMFLAYAVYLGTLVAKHRKAMGGETP